MADVISLRAERESRGLTLPKPHLRVGDVIRHRHHGWQGVVVGFVGIAGETWVYAVVRGDTHCTLERDLDLATEIRPGPGAA